MIGDREPQFDLFLSYNRLDGSVVESLAKELAHRGLRVFKDDWYLRPGECWPPALESNLNASRAALVAVGTNGLGPWQQREVVAALEQQDAAIRKNTSFPVIPLLLGRGCESQAGARIPAAEHLGRQLGSACPRPDRRRGPRQGSRRAL